jgi:hypothetical protein
VRRLFASALTVPFDEGGAETDHRYDEARSLNLDPDGRPIVIGRGSMRTGTVTEVRAETGDRDREQDIPAAAIVGTITKGSGEPPDRHSEMGTQTRVASEPPDHTYREERAPPLLITKSAAPGEPTDRPRAESEAMTHLQHQAHPRLVTR